jgi:hypothetical protein
MKTAETKIESNFALAINSLCDSINKSPPGIAFLSGKAGVRLVVTVQVAPTPSEQLRLV